MTASFYPVNPRTGPIICLIHRPYMYMYAQLFSVHSGDANKSSPYYELGRRRRRRRRMGVGVK